MRFHMLVTSNQNWLHISPIYLYNLYPSTIEDLQMF
nr:MAG TPA: hypothetical protein [Caudoviricetes sp.]